MNPRIRGELVQIKQNKGKMGHTPGIRWTYAGLHAGVCGLEVVNFSDFVYFCVFLVIFSEFAWDLHGFSVGSASGQRLIS